MKNKKVNPNIIAPPMELVCHGPLDKKMEKEIKEENNRREEQYRKALKETTTNFISELVELMLKHEVYIDEYYDYCYCDGPCSCGANVPIYTFKSDKNPYLYEDIRSIIESFNMFAIKQLSEEELLKHRKFSSVRLPKYMINAELKSRKAAIKNAEKNKNK